MDKHTQAKLIWGFFGVCFLLSCWSLCKAWATGEINRSSRSSFKFWTIRREDNPSGFKRYFIGLLLINALFLVVLIIWGIAVFFWS